jgi:outer membrane protein TolC
MSKVFGHRLLFIVSFDSLRTHLFNRIGFTVHEIRFRTWAMALAAAIGTSACTMVGPDFEKPEAEVAASWSDADVEQAVVTESVEHRDWWKNFNDPVLDKLIQTAYEQNLTLQIAGLRVYEARAILGFASGTLYPQVQGANGSAANINISENADPIANLPPSVGSLVDTRFDRYAMSVDAAWELDFWGRFRRGAGVR